MVETRRWLARFGALACLSIAACGSDATDNVEPESSAHDDDDDDDDDDPSDGKRDAGRGKDAGASQARDGGATPRNDAGKSDAGTKPPMSRDRDAGAPEDAGGATTTPPQGSTDLSSCPAPPDDAPEKAKQAWMTVNQLRLAAGAGCMNLVPALIKSAQAHCDYCAANASACRTNPHGEVSGNPGFTGADVQAREAAAGYPRNLTYTEVLTTYGNNPVAAVPNWIDTVWHRIPLLDPWTADMGYGGAAGCDVIDIGRGMSTVPADAVAVYPYDGQTNVPPAFSGLEGPAPPPPPSGWPSAYPVNIYAKALKVSEHVLTKDGDETPIDHLWLDAASSLVEPGFKPYFANTAFLYGAPFDVSTKYRVKIVGTYAGGTLNVEWTFTTAAKRPFGT